MSKVSKVVIKHNMIGQKFNVYCTGMIVEATVTEAYVSGKGTIDEQIHFDYTHEPIQWGSDFFTKGYNSIYTLREVECKYMFNHIGGKRVTAQEIIMGIIVE